MRNLPILCANLTLVLVGVGEARATYQEWTDPDTLLAIRDTTKIFELNEEIITIGERLQGGVEQLAAQTMNLSLNRKDPNRQLMESYTGVNSLAPGILSELRIDNLAAEQFGKFSLYGLGLATITECEGAFPIFPDFVLLDVDRTAYSARKGDALGGVITISHAPYSADTVTLRTDYDFMRRGISLRTPSTRFVANSRMTLNAEVSQIMTQAIQSFVPELGLLPHVWQGYLNVGITMPAKQRIDVSARYAHGGRFYEGGETFGVTRIDETWAHGFAFATFVAPIDTESRKELVFSVGYEGLHHTAEYEPQLSTTHIALLNKTTACSAEYHNQESAVGACYSHIEARALDQYRSPGSLRVWWEEQRCIARIPHSIVFTGSLSISRFEVSKELTRCVSGSIVGFLPSLEVSVGASHIENFSIYNDGQQGSLLVNIANLQRQQANHYLLSARLRGLDTWFDAISVSAFLKSLDVYFNEEFSPASVRGIDLTFGKAGTRWTAKLYGSITKTMLVRQRGIAERQIPFPGSIDKIVKGHCYWMISEPLGVVFEGEYRDGYYFEDKYRGLSGQLGQSIYLSVGGTCRLELFRKDVSIFYGLQNFAGVFGRKNPLTSFIDASGIPRSIDTPVFGNIGVEINW